MFVQDHRDHEWHKLSHADDELMTLCGDTPEGEQWGRATGSLPSPDEVEPKCRALLSHKHRQALFHGKTEPVDGKVVASGGG